MDNEFKTVAKFSDKMKAEIAAGLLRSNGITAAVFNENSSFPALSEIAGILLKVNAEDYDKAVKLLAAADNAE